jgi:hypothetical protein
MIEHDDPHARNIGGREEAEEDGYAAGGNGQVVRALDSKLGGNPDTSMEEIAVRLARNKVRIVTCLHPL